MPKTILITGANSGIGLACARQIALKDGTEKVYLGCRSEEKAKTAKAELEEKTGKKDVYDVLRMDMMSFESVRGAVAALEKPIDCLVLNAGGPGGREHAARTADGVANIMALNVVGNALLVKELIGAGKLESGSTVMYSSSEAARGVDKFGFHAPKVVDGSVEEFKAAIDGTKFSKDKSYETTYSWAKFVGTIYFSSIARKEKDYRFVSVTPGMTTGTNLVNDLGFFQRTMFFLLSPLVKLFGMSHDTDAGAQRYIDVIYMPEKYENGKFYGSKGNKLTGEMGDQTSFFEALGNETYQDNAYAAVQEFL